MLLLYPFTEFSLSVASQSCINSLSSSRILTFSRWVVDRLPPRRIFQSDQFQVIRIRPRWLRATSSSSLRIAYVARITSIKASSYRTPTIHLTYSFKVSLAPFPLFRQFHQNIFWLWLWLLSRSLIATIHHHDPQRLISLAPRQRQLL